MSEIDADLVRRTTEARVGQLVATLIGEIGLLEAHAAALAAENQRLRQQIDNDQPRDGAWGREEGT